MINRMNHEDQDELPLRKQVAPSSRDREYTLSTGIVLSIFFGLALVCAIFFGFGYTLGRKSMQQTVAADGTTDGGDTAAFSKFKPAAGSTSASNTPAPVAPKQETPSTPVQQTTAITAPAPTPTTVVRQPIAETPAAAPVVHQPAPVPAAPAPTPVAIATGGSTMVQIAAVSHAEDADVLTAALRRRGYSVVKKQEPGDRLIHVQVGPFASRKDAEVMKQKLLNDGYNALIK